MEQIDTSRYTDPQRSQQIMYPSSCWKSQIHLVTLSSPTAGSTAVAVTVVDTTISAAADPLSSRGRPAAVPPPSPSVVVVALVVGDGGASGDDGGVHGRGAV